MIIKTISTVKDVVKHVLAVIKAGLKNHPYALTLGAMITAAVLFQISHAQPQEKVFRLTTKIEDAALMDSMADGIAGLKPGEKATLIVDSYGGHVQEGMKIVTALHKTKGDVTCVSNSGTISMAASILVTCKKISMSKYSLVLFHVVRVYDLMGTANYMDNDPYAKALNAILYESTSDILTSDEKIRMFLKHEDIVLTGTKFQARMCLARKVGCSPVL